MSARPQMPELLSRLPTTGDLVGGKYRVEGTAGVGGMGVVLRARHEELGHQVAIKLLASDEDISAEAIERFLREGKIIASLQSDHVVRIYDVGRLESGIPFMVMEFLRGQDLGEYVAAAGAVPMRQAVDWLLQASHAISEAHERGIIHRDLKPSNLFLTARSDGTDCVKVLDFGISKRISVQDSGQFGPNLTTTRQIVGSPAYMSPEQVRNTRDIDNRVDIWALGMTLYELLAGRTAFDADTFPAVCAAIVADSPPPLQELVPGIPQKLVDIVLKCLEKEPAKRYPSVGALVNDLRQFGSPASQVISKARTIVESSREPSLNNPSTLVSSTPEPTVRDPGGKAGLLPSSDMFRDRTMNSADHDAIAISQQRTKKKLPKRAGWILLPFLAVGFGSVAIWKITHPRNARTVGSSAVASTSKAPTNEQFVVRIESVPSEAEVWDGTQLLGNTPLTIALSHSAVQATSKRFTITKTGYEPFVALQGDATHDVTITAPLIAQQEPQPLPSVTPNQPKRQAKAGVSRRVPPSSEAANPLDSNDIRSKR